MTREQLHYARLKVGQDSVWELFAEDGEMRMYKREEEVDGMVVDPLKALHQVTAPVKFISPRVNFVKHKVWANYSIKKNFFSNIIIYF